MTNLKELAKALESMADNIDKDRLHYLFDDGVTYESVSVSPLAEQHFLIGLASLEQASRQMKLAALYVAMDQTEGQGTNNG